MDIKEFVSAAIDGLKQGHFYSEIEESKLKQTIEDFLEDEYNKTMEELLIILEMSETTKGSDSYKKIITAATKKTADKAKDIFANRKDLL